MKCQVCGEEGATQQVAHINMGKNPHGFADVVCCDNIKCLIAVVKNKANQKREKIK
jgi:hypothetical protein